MMGEIKFQKEIKLGNGRYVAYLKEVATRLGEDGKTESTTTRAFIKRVKGITSSKKSASF